MGIRDRECSGKLLNPWILRMFVRPDRGPLHRAVASPRQSPPGEPLSPTAHVRQAALLDDASRQLPVAGIKADAGMGCRAPILGIDMADAVGPERAIPTQLVLPGKANLIT